MRGVTHEGKIDEQYEKSGDFERGFGERYTEEVNVVHCAPPASNVFTAGSMASSRMRGYRPTHKLVRASNAKAAYSGQVMGSRSCQPVRGWSAAVGRTSVKKAFCKARHVYATPTTMPTPAVAVHQGFAFQEPARTCSSATNPENPGRPIDAMPAITNASAAKGRRRAR